MKEKKQFFIPKNYNKKFEWIPGISGWQHLAFVPVAGLDYLIIQHTPFDFSNKLIFIAISLGLPWILMATRPVRDNVSMYKHLMWKLKFMSRQRTFQYKKEGYVDVIKQIEKVESEPKERGTSKKDNSTIDTDQGNRARITYNTRPENGSMSKSIGS